MKSLKKIGLLFVLVLGFVSFASAKEMPQRLGVGIKNNTSQSLPSLAGIYHVNGNFAVTGGLGLDTEKNYSSTQIQVGIRHVIFHEANLHFYMGGQLGMVTFETPALGKENGIEANLILGTEFFFAGLENIGFSFEGGFGLSTVYDTRVRTIADDPFRAGVVFYF